MKFSHLSLHTHFSCEGGTIMPEQLVQHASHLGLDSICATDNSNMFVSAELSSLATQHNIKVIYGITCNIDSEYGNTPMTLYAKNLLGYRSVQNLLAYGYSNSKRFKGAPIFNWDDLKGIEHVFCVVGGMFGYLGHALLHDPERCDQALEVYINAFGHGNVAMDIHRCYELLDFREDLYNRRAIDMAFRKGIPIVANNYVRFLHAEDFKYYKAMNAVHSKELLYGGMHNTYTKEMYMKSAQDMSSLFRDYPEAIENTRYITDTCNVYLPSDRIPLFTKIKNQVSNKSVDEQLDQLLDKGFRERLSHVDQETLEKVYFPRLQKEKHVIYTRGYAHYFLMVAMLAQWSISNKIPKGPGRGSSAGSLLAYLLYVTDLDPIKHGLIFERFMNLERESMPDIDIDFCMNKREEVIAYLKDSYGQDKVAQIIAHSYLGVKSSIKEISRVMGYHFKEANEISMSIPFEANTIDEAMLSKEFTHVVSSGMNRLLFDYCKFLDGRFKSSSRHAAGIVIVPQNLDNLGVYYPEDDKQHAVIHWNMYYLELLGLLKLDCLGLRTLTSINHIQNLIEEKSGVWPDLTDIYNRYDQKTYELISSGKTDGVFQLESLSMQSFLTKCPMSKFEDIVAMISLNRPGPINAGMLSAYIELANGRQEPELLHPLIDDILQETYGLIIYQEQIMQIINRVGISLSKGADLQKAISKKQESFIANFKKEFSYKAVQVGMNTEISDRVFKIIMSFGSYGFNKSHAASYSVLTYQTAYLKAHYGSFFYKALLSSNVDKDKLTKYLLSCIQSGIKVLNPCINKGDWEYQCLDNNTLRCGLKQIKGINKTLAKRIISERLLNKAYLSLVDFIKRVFGLKTGIKMCEGLIYAGAMDCLQQPRTHLLGILEYEFKRAHYEIRLAENPKTRCVPYKDKKFLPWLDYAPINREHIVDQETKSLSICLSRCPVSLYQNWLNKLGIKSFLDEPKNLLQRFQRNTTLQLYAGVIVSITQTKFAHTVKVINDNKTMYVRLNQKAPAGVLPGKVVIIRGCRAYVNRFYNEMFTKAVSITTIREEINNRLSSIHIDVRVQDLQAFLNAINCLFMMPAFSKNGHPLKFCITVKTTTCSYWLEHNLKVSAYDLYYTLASFGELRYTLKV